MNREDVKNMDAVRFLFVDDDDISIMALERSVKQLEITNPIAVATNGVDALAILEEAIGSSGKLPPYIVTLDLNMPKMGGLEFLERVRHNEAFKQLIVFVLTTSDAPSDIASAYEYNIAGYIVKQTSNNTYRDALAMIKSYSELVELPSSAQRCAK